MSSKYFSDSELMCHGASQGHCSCGTDTASNVSPILLEKLDAMREMIGGPIYLSCAYRCPAHNAEIPGSAKNSQHVLGNAADVIVPDYDHCHTVDQLAWYAQQAGFDGIGRYYDDEFVHVDVRDGGESPNYYTWEG